MTITLFLILVITNLWLAYNKQYSKIITILTLVAILMFMAGAGPEYATENRSLDYINYERRYNNITNVGITYDIQIGYTIIQKIGAFLGLNFFWFRLTVIAICLIILYFFVIKKYTNNVHYFLTFYLMYPMIIDSEQLRNFIAMTIILSAINLLRKKTSIYKILYFLMVILAGTIHTVFLLYLPLIFITQTDNNWFTKLVTACSLGLMGIMFLNGNKIPFADTIIAIMDEERITRYLSSSTSLGFVMPLILTISSIILVYWSKKISDTEKYRLQKLTLMNPDIIINENRLLIENNFVNLVFWINLLSTFFFPFFMITIQFYRMPRNLLILNLVTYSITINKLKKDSLHRIIYIISIVITMFLWLLIDLIITTEADRVLIPFFTNNSFFN